jgi:hypothetical protein
MGLIAPILWNALVDGPGQRWSEQSYSQGIGDAGMAKCLGDVRSVPAAVKGAI